MRTQNYLADQQPGYGAGERSYLLEIMCVDEILFGQESQSCLSSWTENLVSTYKIHMNKSQDMKKLVALTKHCIKFNKVLFSTPFLPGYSTG